MTYRYLRFGKLIILLLAVAGPFLLYQGFRNQRELILRDAAVRESVSGARREFVRQMIYRFFSEPDLLAKYRLRRTLPHGEIEGMPPLTSAFFDSAGIALGVSDARAQPFLSLIWEEGSYFSGLPKRYAGMIELLRLESLELSTRDRERLFQVVAQFQRGVELSQNDLGYLLGKLPGRLQPQFETLGLFAGTLCLANGSEFWVGVRAEGQFYLLALDRDELDALNRFSDALELDLVFSKSDRWADWGEVSLTLDSRRLPSSKRLRQSARLYLVMGVGLVLVLGLLYWVLARYETVNRTQKQLLAATSHELRTPLAVIRQFSEMLLDREAQFPERYGNYHRHIHRESLKMQFMVENLLSAARFEYLPYRPHGFCKIFRKTVKKHSKKKSC